MRLIDADALMVSKQWENCTCPAQVIHNAPTIDPETLRPKGRWDIIECDKKNKRIFVECECGATFKLSVLDFALCYNYCPNCGADMRGESK